MDPGEAIHTVYLLCCMVDHVFQLLAGGILTFANNHDQGFYSELIPFARDRQTSDHSPIPPGANFCKQSVPTRSLSSLVGLG